MENEQFRKGMEQAKRDMDANTSSAERNRKSLQMIERGALAVGGAVVAAIGGSAKVAADFEQSMARVAAITGSTDEEMAQLESTARELGSTTQFSASEAASAMEFLGMAGFSTNEIISAMPGVLNLAASAAVDLGLASDAVSNIMTGFGMSAEETDRAVDVLVATMTSANTNLPQLADAMKYVAPVAASLGLDIEETAAAIGKMSDAGIQGSQAGTTMRAMLLSLASPTGRTKDAMEDLGISITDANDEMLPLSEIIGVVSDAMEGMTDVQKTQYAEMLVGTQAASGFLALLEEGEDGLANYTEELRNSEGAAKEMADTQNDTVNGAFREFKSAMSEIGISIGQEFLPVIRDVVERATELTRKFGDLDPATVALGLKMAGTAAGVTLVVTSVIKLGTAIRGLYAAMGPAGWLILGLSAVAAGVVAWNDRSKRAAEVNAEVADATIEQADSLESLADRYDELRGKSRLTTDQIGELLDIQQRMERESDPEELKKLENAYDDIAEKSGLSKDEISELLAVNNEIIEQTPHVEQTMSERGNAVVDATDAVRDYIQSLRDMALEELQMERIAALEREAELRKEHRDDLLEQEEIGKRLEILTESRNMSEDERRDRVSEINRLINDEFATGEELVKLERERDVLMELHKTGMAETHGKLREQKEEIDGKLELHQDEIDKLGVIDEKIAGILLTEIGINEVGEEGLKIADEKLQKLRDEKAEIEEQISKEGDKHGVLGMQVDTLNEQISKHENIVGQIEEETGLKSDILGKEDEHNRKLEQNRAQLDLIEDSMLGNTRAQEGTNDKIDEGTAKAGEMTDELGKDVDKAVNVSDGGDIADINRRASSPVTKIVSVRERLLNSVGLSRHNGGPVGQYRPGDGAPAGKLHTGGLASQLMNAPMHNEVDVRLLRNEMVLTEGQQANLFRSLQGGGQSTGGSSEAYLAEIAGGIAQIERKIQEIDPSFTIELDGEEVGRKVEPHVSTNQHDKHGVQRIFNGDWGR
ncbi:phage tail tape measure protein [Alteribacter populi]|uniref:phage tail tape measure protein n=1 Tax=Alteribacter populi TaxID=2011011 RepID=UPI000BBB56A4|nr:phage tail tape measure protein [Alteribacter populi]